MPHHPYAVFTSRQTGKAAAIANYMRRRDRTVALDNGGKLSRFRLVDDPK
jgi:hypothetical protein